MTKDKIRFNAPLKDFIPPEQLDAEWEGGLNRYKFDYEVYWKTFVVSIASLLKGLARP